MKPQYIFSLLFLLLPVSAAWATEAGKTINKSYQISKNTRLEFQNKFGRVHIETWDKNQLDVKVEIRVEARSEKRAQEILEEIRIDIDDANPASFIAFETEFEKGKLLKGGSRELEVNYTIKMPPGNTLDVENRFGDTYLEKHTGRVKLFSGYGSLKTGPLSGASEVEVQFGSGDVELMKEGKLRVKYSNVELQTAGILDVETEFSDLEIRTADQLELEARYGEVNIGTVNSLEGSAGFSGLDIGTINKRLVMEAKYVSDLEVDQISSQAELVDIRNQFGQTTLNFAEGAGGNLEAELSFGELNAPSNINYSIIQKDNNKSYYEGSFGKGNTRIKLYNRYGNIRIRL